MKALVALIVAFAALAASEGRAAEAGESRDAAPLASLPYAIDYDGWITVEATVNGAGPYDFIIDTGATITFVFENILESQDLAPSALPPRRILGFASALTVPMTAIGDVSLGGLALDDHQGPVLADWDPPRRTPHGVIGLDLLARYVVVIDAEAQRINLYAEGKTPSPVRRWRGGDLEAETFGQEGGGVLYTIEARVNSRSYDFIVDLGASITLVNYPLLRSLLGGVRINDPAASGSRVSDVNDTINRAQYIRVDRMRIGKANWRRPVFLVYDALIFRELGMGDTPFGLLGADLLKHRSFAFDFPGERFYVGPEAR